MVVGAIPFGIVFGAIAINAGLSPLATLGMSLFVYAGASQFIAAGLVAQGAGLGLIVATTFIVNLRHALYAASLAPFLSHLPHRWLMPLGFWLTDETYAAVISRYQEHGGNQHRHWFYLGSALFMYGNWQLCTMIGIVAGQQLDDAASWGLDFAMIATFIGIIVPLVRTRPMLVCALVSAVTALFSDHLPNQLGLMIAALAGIAAGMLADSLNRPGGKDQSQ